MGRDTKNSTFAFSISLVDPYLVVNQKYRKRLLQAEAALLKKVAAFNFVVWPVIYVATYFLNDLSKPDPETWRNYRLAVASVVIALGLMQHFSKSDFARKVCLFLLAATLSASFSWSTNLGQSVQSKWIVIFPSLIFIFAFRSVVFSSVLLVFIVYATSSLWEATVKRTWIVTDVEIAIFTFIIAYVFRSMWIASRINGFVNEDMQREMLEDKEIFYNQIKSFISPVYLEKIRECTIKHGYSFVTAVDEVLALKTKTVAVVYSDLRGFSRRAGNLEFLEKEFIPYGVSLIDPAEKNMGVARQIADSILIYYDLEDPEEALLRAVKDGVRGCLIENQKVKDLGKAGPERYFTVTFGTAVIGNIASHKHREATIMGDPANLGARIDALTKEPNFLEALKRAYPCIIFEPTAAKTFKTFSKSFVFEDVSLRELGLELKSYQEIESVSLFPLDSNKAVLDKLLLLNKLEPVSIGLDHG